MDSGCRERMLDDYVIVRTLGEGGYGKVFLGRHRKTGELMALKVLDYDLLTAEERQTSFATYRIEFDILSQLTHPNIVRCVALVEKGAYRSKNRTRSVGYAVSEFCEGGELFELLASGGGLSENSSRHYFLQLVETVLFLHEKGVAHRDLKPENLLFDGDFRLKLVDFGFASRTAAGELSATELGSEGYRAPEFYSTPVRYVGARTDAFAAGVILFELFTGLPPFRRPTSACQLFVRLRAGDPAYWAHYEKATGKQIPPDLRALLSGLLREDPESRLTLAQARDSPWLRAPIDSTAAVAEVRDRAQKMSQPIELSVEVDREEKKASRSGGESGDRFLRYRIDAEKESTLGGIRFISSDPQTTLETLRATLAGEDEIGTEVDSKGRLILRLGPTSAKVVVSTSANPTTLTARLLLQQGNYSDLISLKKELLLAMQRMA